jgi:hypothetical protein
MSTYRYIWILTEQIFEMLSTNVSHLGLDLLGNNVYQNGTQDQGYRFTRTTEAIANYVGREYSKEIRLLVKNR